MSHPDPSTSPIYYEVEPFESVFLARRDEILKLVAVSTNAMHSVQGMGRLSRALRHSSERIAEAEAFEANAKAEIEADHPVLHSAGTVLIWGALEASFRDFASRWLERHPECRRSPLLKNLKVRLVEYDSLEGEERMRYILGIIEREVGATLKPGVGRFECVLEVLGIAPRLNADERKSLSELAAVRNVIVHRASVADQRLLDLCPWLPWRVGEPVKVSKTLFLSYVDAASHYAANIIQAAERSVQREAPAE